MSHISVKNNRTGNVVDFEWNHDLPPTEDDIQAIEDQQDAAKKKNSRPNYNPISPLMDLTSDYGPDVLKGAAGALGLPSSVDDVKASIADKVHHPVRTALTMNPLTGMLVNPVMGMVDQFSKIPEASRGPLPGLAVGGRIAAGLAGPLGTQAAGAGEDIGSGDPHRIVQGAVKGSGAILGGLGLAGSIPSYRPTAQSLPDMPTQNPISDYLGSVLDRREQQRLVFPQDLPQAQEYLGNYFKDILHPEEEQGLVDSLQKPLSEHTPNSLAEEASLLLRALKAKRFGTEQ